LRLVLRSRDGGGTEGRREHERGGDCQDGVLGHGTTPFVCDWYLRWYGSVDSVGAVALGEVEPDLLEVALGLGLRDLRLMLGRRDGGGTDRAGKQDGGGGGNDGVLHGTLLWFWGRVSNYRADDIDRTVQSSAWWTNRSARPSGQD